MSAARWMRARGEYGAYTLAGKWVYAETELECMKKFYKANTAHFDVVHKRVRYAEEERRLRIETNKQQTEDRRE